MLHLLLASLLLSAAPIEVQGEEPQRFALIIGANIGNPEEGKLQYATADARNVATTLESVAGFTRRRMIVLSNPTATDVRSQFEKLKRIIQAEAGQKKFLLVYYSGHADAISLHLGGTQLSWLDLVQLTNDVEAGTRLVVADACRSGELTQVKGAHVVSQPFLLPGREATLPQGIAVITSASAGETAQESSSFHGSFFTHHFLAALRGAADQNKDGQVSLEEAFNYSSTQTLFDTAKTMTGAQHATYRVKMRGRGMLTLSFPKTAKGLATLHITDPGYYLLRGGKADDASVMELQIPQNGDRRVWLAAGEYQVQRRTDNVLYEGDVKLSPSVVTHLSMESLSLQNTVAYAGKGGGPAQDADEGVKGQARVFGSFGTATLYNQNLPYGGGISLGIRVHRRIWLEAMGEVATATGPTSGPWRVTQVAVNALGGLRGLAVDAAHVALWAGARAGAATLFQSYTGSPGLSGRRQTLFVTEAFASLDWKFYEPFSVSLEAGPRLEYPDLVQDAGQSTHIYVLSGYLRLGLVASF